MASEKIDKEKNPVAYAREKHRERLKNWRPSPELEDAIKEKKPAENKDEAEKQPEKKIARPKPREGLDL